MQNFNDIKPIILGSPINILNTFLFIIFIIILYLLWKNLNKTKINNIIKQENIKPKINYKIFFEDKLSLLEQKYLREDKDIFYKKISKILKEILEYKGINNISKMSFEEINNLKLKKGLLNLIKNIYFKEYAKNIEDSKEYRKKLILEIKKLI